VNLHALAALLLINVIATSVIAVDLLHLLVVDVVDAGLLGLMVSPGVVIASVLPAHPTMIGLHKTIDAHRAVTAMEEAAVARTATDTKHPHFAGL
jgi:hypothetical protein